MRKHIRRIYGRAKHGLARLWRWAKGHAGRFAALASWARWKGHHSKGGEWAKKAAVYERKAKWLAQHKDPKPSPGNGTISIDGVAVAAWIAHWVLQARNRGLWHGYVVSGYRSPAYSTSLCVAMCGHPTCPGTCAGATSNHSGLIYPAGAVDVDVAHRNEFANAMQKLGSPLHNALGPADPNHFSASGR